MTEPKILTPAEALRALADGEKLTSIGAKGLSYLHLVDGEILARTGARIPLHSFEGFSLYTEPKPKRKVAPYYIEYADGAIELKPGCFETDAEAKKHYRFNVRVTRCMVLEREF